LPVNAAIPAKANKEAQNEAKKDDEQQGRHVEHFEILRARRCGREQYATAWNL
jgi:hypothetical protein